MRRMFDCQNCFFFAARKKWHPQSGSSSPLNGVMCTILTDCRFTMVLVGSENSSRLIFDKLSQKVLHGMLPTVLHYTIFLSESFFCCEEKVAPQLGSSSPLNGVIPVICTILTVAGLQR